MTAGIAIFIGALYYSNVLTALPTDSIEKEASINEVTITSTVGSKRKVAGKGRTASIEEAVEQCCHGETRRICLGTSGKQYVYRAIEYNYRWYEDILCLYR